MRWPDGVTCPRCGSAAVTPRDRCDHGLQRCHGVPCAGRWGQQGALGTDGTRAIFEESQCRPRAWWLVMGLGQVQLHATALAAAADLQERPAQRCLQRLAGGLDETSPREPTRPRAPQGAAEEG